MPIYQAHTRIPEGYMDCWLRHFFATVERERGEWLSTCCGAPPSRATPDVGEDNQAGICGQCREHTGFERREE